MSSMRAQVSAPSESFRQLVTTLYGETVDPAAVWQVAKASPDQSDVHKPTTLKRVLEGTALASTVAGGVLGVKEGTHAIRAVRSAVKAGQKVPGKEWGKLGVAGLATGGDALTTGVLAAQNRRTANQQKKLQPTGVVAKYATGTLKTPRLHKVASGLRRIWAGQNPGAAPKAAVTQPHLPGMGSAVKHPKWRSAGQELGDVMSTKTGKVMAGGLAVAGASGANRQLRRRTAGVDYADDYYAYGKADTVDVEFGGSFSKLDTDKRLAFGWASVTKVNGTPIVDKQGDYIDLTDLEDAAYKYVHSSRVGGDMHKRDASMMGDQAHKVSDMVESIVFTPEKIAAMGLPEDFPQGWWVGYRIHDDETWDLVKKRERTGFSIHGRGLRKAADLDEIMGYH